MYMYTCSPWTTQWTSQVSSRAAKGARHDYEKQPASSDTEGSYYLNP